VNRRARTNWLLTGIRAGITFIRLVITVRGRCCRVVAAVCWTNYCAFNMLKVWAVRAENQPRVVSLPWAIELRGAGTLQQDSVMVAWMGHGQDL
jgi:hypothetical protein